MHDHWRLRDTERGEVEPRFKLKWYQTGGVPGRHAFYRGPAQRLSGACFASMVRSATTGSRCPSHRPANGHRRASPFVTSRTTGASVRSVPAASSRSASTSRTEDGRSAVKSPIDTARTGIEKCCAGRASAWPRWQPPEASRQVRIRRAAPGWRASRNGATIQAAHRRRLSF